VTSTDRRPNAFRLLLGLVDRPGRTLASIANQPRWVWVLPVVVAIAFAVAALVITLPYATADSQAEIQRQLAGLPAEQLGMVSGYIDQLQQPAVMLSIGIGSRLLWMLVSWLFATVVLYFCILLSGADVVSPIRAFPISSLPGYRPRMQRITSMLCWPRSTCSRCGT